MITVHDQFCPMPALMHGMRCKFMVMDADTLDEAEKADACANAKGWQNYMGGIATDETTGKPSLVMIKAQ